MKALSIRQPWAWAILHAGKRIENRRWNGCRYRGPLLIHAAKGCARPEYEEAAHRMSGKRLASWRRAPDAALAHLPDLVDLDRGGIVGVCNIVGVIDHGMYADHAYPSDPAHRIESPWYEGILGLMLADVRPLPFIPFKGALGFFDVPDHLLPAEARRP